MIDRHLTEIEKKLRSVINREYKRNALTGLSLFIISLCILILILSFTELCLNLGPGIRTVLFYIAAALCCAMLIILVLTDLYKSYLTSDKAGYFRTAAQAGIYFPETKDELLNVLQLVSNDNSNYSNQLIEAAFERAYDKTRDKNFNEVIDFRIVRKYFRGAVSAAILTVLLFTFVPGLSSAGYRILHYGKEFIPPRKFVFEVSPGNALISKGENIAIKIRAVGLAPKEITLSVKPEDEGDFTERNLRADSLGYFRYEAVSVKNSFDYRAEAGGISSGIYRISVVNKPYIAGFEADVTPPAYTGIPEQIQKDDGNINALPGSKVKIILKGSRELSSALIYFSDSSRIKMQIEADRAASEFPVSIDRDYKIIITDSQGYSNPNPITYSIRALADMPPSIEMISPNTDIKLGKETGISLVSRISDDYGFSGMYLNYRLAASKFRQPSDQFTKIPIPISNTTKEDEIYYVWDLAPLVPAEGEVFSYYLEVFDNDNIRGPKSARTSQFTITVPSFDEILAKTDDKGREIEKELKDSFKEAGKLKEEMTKIADDIKQNTKEISWQEKERIEKAGERFKQIGKKIEEASRELSEMKNDLAKNNLLSEETMKKYNELQELLDQFNDEGLKEALRKLQESLRKMTRENVQISLEEMKNNEEYLRKSLERTLNLLKRIQIEQKADELKKRAENLAAKIDAVKEKTENSFLSEKQTRDKLAALQKDITGDLNLLNGEMKDLNEKMSPMADMPKQTASELEKELEDQKNENLSEEAENEIKEEQKQPAVGNQGQLSRNVKKIGKGIQNLQAGMRKMNQIQTLYDMMKIMNDLIQLSKDEESLKNSTQQTVPFSQGYPELLRKQSELENDLSRVSRNMAALSQKTFAVTPEMGKALGDAMSHMNQSMRLMHDQNGPQASQIQINAMASINEAAELLKSGMNQMMSGSQGGGMMSLMEQLQQMSQQQMGLNKLTQMLNQGGMSQEMMGEIERLAQQQEMIRKSLEQLNKEARESGESKRVAANLEKISSEMKEVVSNLRSRKVNDDLVKQQERILSKLLDAQKSINERDFEDDRKSTSGNNISRSSPAELMLKSDEGRNKLKEELFRAMHEGYKKDYEELIRKYFEELQDRKQ
jgi:hypothetical protein